jgi:glycosyltransferase involved in cell wall biosynthesis
MNVSVALCTYNGEDYLEEQLESILNQTYDLYEIVVFDDNSDDSTPSILQEYRNEYPYLFDVNFNEENLGISRNFDRCIRHCEGEVIAISDQDDIWHKEKIDRQIKAFQQNDAVLVFHNSTLISEEADIGDLWSQVSYIPGTARHRQQALNRLFKGNFIQGAATLFDADIRSHLLPIPHTLQYDYFLSFVSLALGGLYDIDEELIKYRQHEDQDTGLDVSTSPIDRMRQITEIDRSEHHAERMDEFKHISNRLKQISEKQDTQWLTQIVEQVDRKCQYEQYESQIYDPKVRTGERLSYIWSNLRSGRYDDFGWAGQITALKDLMGVALIQ